MKRLLSVFLALALALSAARSFTANTHVVSVGDQTIYNFDTSTSYTVSGWVYHTAVGATQRYVSKQFDNLWTVRLSSGSKLEAIVGKVSGTLQTLTASTSLSANTWYHFAFVRNVGSDTLKLYLSTATGSVTEDASATDTTTDTHGTSGVLTIGKFNSDATETVQGRLANITIWNRALTVPELESVKWGRLVGTGRIGYWPLNGNSPEPDLSGSNKPGTVTGAGIGDNPPVGPSR